MEPKRTDALSDEDLAPPHLSFFSCDGYCPTNIFDLSKPIFLCVSCCNVFCVSCHEDFRAEEDLRPSIKRRISYPGHKLLKAPFEGWGGVKNGMMMLGERKVNFHGLAS
jgi:hypothetical protein